MSDRVVLISGCTFLALAVATGWLIVSTWHAWRLWRKSASGELCATCGTPRHADMCTECGTYATVARRRARSRLLVRLALAWLLLLADAGVVRIATLTPPQRYALLPTSVLIYGAERGGAGWLSADGCWAEVTRRSLSESDYRRLAKIALSTRLTSLPTFESIVGELLLYKAEGGRVVRSQPSNPAPEPDAQTATRLWTDEIMTVVVQTLYARRAKMDAPSLMMTLVLLDPRVIRQHAVTIWDAACDDDNSGRLLRKAIARCGHMEQPDIEHLFTSPDPRIRRVGVEAAARWPQRKDTVNLLSLAQQDRDPLVSSMARGALSGTFPQREDQLERLRAEDQRQLEKELKQLQEDQKAKKRR